MFKSVVGGAFDYVKECVRGKGDATQQIESFHKVLQDCVQLFPTDEELHGCQIFLDKTKKEETAIKKNRDIEIAITEMNTCVGG